MSTRTLRGLAAGAGAAAVLFAGAAGASASQSNPQPGTWEDQFEEEGYTNVSCIVSPLPGNKATIAFHEETLDTAPPTPGWGQWLEDGNDWIKVVLKEANEYQVQDWQGYAPVEYTWKGGDQGESPTNLTHAILCQAASDDDNNGVTPGDGDQTDEPTETEDPTDDGDDKDKDDDKDDKPTGPPVETDGPATPSGPNMGLMGGAALLLGGAGAAGWAMRRRAGEH